MRAQARASAQARPGPNRPWARREGFRRDSEENAGLRAPLRQDRKPPVVLAARRCDDPLGHLALKHQDHAVEPGRPRVGLEPGDEEGVSRRHRAGWRRCGQGREAQAREVDLHRVSGHDIETSGIGCGDRVERGQKAGVLFDGDDAPCAFDQKGAGEASGAGPDLDDRHAFKRAPPRGRCAGSG